MRSLSAVVVLFAFCLSSGAQNQVPGKGQPYTTYQVNQGETLYSISKRFLVEQSELIFANPELASGLKAGQIIRIPGSGSGSGTAPQVPVKVGGQNTPALMEYKVKKGESLYFIARQFGVGVEDILRYNPDARDGIDRNDVLLIPQREDLEQIKNQKKNAVNTLEGERKHSNEPAQATLVPHAGDAVPDRMAASRTYNICLLLPLYLSANDTIDRDRNAAYDELQNDSLLTDRMHRQETLSADSLRPRAPAMVYPRSENFLHFYEGFLLAADSLKRAGMKFKLEVFDTNQKRYVIDSLVNSGSLKNADLIIGPMFPELQKSVSDFAFRQHIPVVSPLSSSGNFEDRNPWFFKVNPVRKLLVRETADYIVQKYSSANVIILRLGGYDQLAEGELVRLVKEKFSGVQGNGGMGACREYSLIADGAAGLEALLRKDLENVFIIPSETEAQVSVAVTTLNALAVEYPVTLVGLSAFQRFKSIQTEYFHRVRMNLLTPYYVDYTSAPVNQFIRKFRRNFAAEPNQYSFQGYDVTFYFMSALFRFGKDFTAFLPQINPSLLQSDLIFEKVRQDGGYMNGGLFILEYTPDFDIISKGVRGRGSR